MASLLLDGVLAALLIATIVYAAMLDRRLRTLRQSRDELQALLTNFTAATTEAQAGMASLRETTQTAAKDLKGELERAKALREDLAFLMERGDELADRLEGGVGAARAATRAATVAPQAAKPSIRLADPVPAAPQTAARAKPAADEKIADFAARDLMRVLKTAR